MECYLKWYIKIISISYLVSITTHILIFFKVVINKMILFKMNHDIHPSIHWAVDPRQGFAPLPGSHNRHAPLWCLARLPVLISFLHPPQVTILTCPPLLTPTPTSHPPTAPSSLHPPARPNMPSIICPTYPSPTSPALPPISLPPIRPTRTSPNVTYPLPFRIETPPTSLTLQPPTLFIHPVHPLLMHN